MTVVIGEAAVKPSIQIIRFLNLIRTNANAKTKTPSIPDVCDKVAKSKYMTTFHFRTQWLFSLISQYPKSKKLIAKICLNAPNPTKYISLTKNKNKLNGTLVDQT